MTFDYIVSKLHYVRTLSSGQAETFEAAGGSIVGTAHLRAGRNGQDAWAVVRRGQVAVAVVADGCGSAPHSEVGAKLGAMIAARALLARADAPAAAATTIVRRLRAIAATLGDDVERVMHDYFLFTLVAAVITPLRTTILSAGDGLFAINDEVRTLGPFPGNAPPYLGYGDTALVTEAQRPTAEVSRVILATDGALQLPADLRDFARDELLFRNPDGVRRRLFRYTRPPQPVLDDDTTIVVLRRRV